MKVVKAVVADAVRVVKVALVAPAVGGVVEGFVVKAALVVPEAVEDFVAKVVPVRDVIVRLDQVALVVVVREAPVAALAEPVVVLVDLVGIVMAVVAEVLDLAVEMIADVAPSPRLSWS